MTSFKHSTQPLFFWINVKWKQWSIIIIATIESVEIRNIGTVLNNLIFLILGISLFSDFFLRNFTCTILSIIVHGFTQQLQAILPILHRSNDVSSCTRFCEIQETCCYCVELRQFFITMITYYGLAPGGYSDDIQCQLTMADLFR